MLTLIRPFVDPANTFRAVSISDMFKIVPEPQKYWNTLETDGSSFQYDVGVNSLIRSLFFSIQNRTVSHTLRVELTLPSYIKSDHNLQVDVTKETIKNIILSFDEEQVKTILPGVIQDFIIFDVYPINVNGPVFVSTTMAYPPDLNETVGYIESGSVPDPIIPGEGTEGPIFIDRDVEVQVEVIKWIDGTDDTSKPWPPPNGWSVGSDGKMYPPLPSPSNCDIVSDGTGRDGDLSNAILTPLEKLIKESLINVPPTYGTDTRRRGYVIDTSSVLTGDRPDGSSSTN